MSTTSPLPPYEPDFVENLYIQHRSLLMYVSLRKFRVPEESAEQLLQDAFLRFLKGDTTNPKAPIRAQLVAEMIQVCREYWSARPVSSPEALDPDQDTMQPLYDLRGVNRESSPSIITEIGPRIVIATKELRNKLRLAPEEIFHLAPRRFEELIAELLAEMGFDVQLTPQSRDGGKDVMAYMPTPFGRLLILVEAKQRASGAHVGVSVVRELYGTLIDSGANAALLVTTASFSGPACAFQRAHEYQLRLADYSILRSWLTKAPATFTVR